MVRRMGWVAAILAGVLLVACAQATEVAPTRARNADGYVDLSVDELAAMLVSEDVLLINTHIPYDGELPDTDLFIPYDEIAAHQDKLSDKDETIVLYCRSGSMSTAAARELVSLGYTNVFELDGGMVAWESAGQELIRR